MDNELAISGAPVVAGGEFVALVAGAGEGRLSSDAVAALLERLGDHGTVQLSTDDVLQLLSTVGGMAAQLSEAEAAQVLTAPVGQEAVTDPRAHASADAATVFRAVDAYVSDCAQRTMEMGEYELVGQTHELAQARMSAYLGGTATEEIPVFSEAHIRVAQDALRARIRILAAQFVGEGQADAPYDVRRLAIDEANAAYDALLGLLGQKESLFTSLTERFADPDWCAANPDLQPEPRLDVEEAAPAPEAVAVPVVVPEQVGAGPRRPRVLVALVAAAVSSINR